MQYISSNYGEMKNVYITPNDRVRVNNCLKCAQIEFPVKIAKARVIFLILLILSINIDSSSEVTNSAYLTLIPLTHIPFY